MECVQPSSRKCTPRPYSGIFHLLSPMEAAVAISVLMKPMTDLCWTCQQNSTAILKVANFPEREKSDVLKAAEEHLQIVQLERSFYKTTCDDCRKSISDEFTLDGVFQPPPPSSQSAANSRDIKAHYIALISPAGSLSLQPPPTWPHLLPHTSEVQCVRSELRSNPPADQLHPR